MVLVITGKAVEGQGGRDHMCVKVEHCNRLIVGPLQGAKSWKGDGVVAAEGDEFRVDMRCGIRV